MGLILRPVPLREQRRGTPWQLSLLSERSSFFLGSEPKHKRSSTVALSDIARTLSVVETKWVPTCPFQEANFELDIAEPTVRNPPNLTAESSTVELPGDIWGTRKEINGDAGKALTDARETWDDVGTLISVPFWRSEVAKFGPLLLGKKVVFRLADHPSRKDQKPPLP
jgi:hypothetical protein